MSSTLIVEGAFTRIDAGKYEKSLLIQLDTTAATSITCTLYGSYTSTDDGVTHRLNGTYTLTTDIMEGTYGLVLISEASRYTTLLLFDHAYFDPTMQNIAQFNGVEMSNVSLTAIMETEDTNTQTDSETNFNTQGGYVVRRTLNYLDLIEGRQYHSTPITFNEFLSKPESLFIYEQSFMQVPGYVQSGAEIAQVEESARAFVVDWMIDEFSDRLLGMQDYVRWAKLFKNKCLSVTPSFWAQVNMINLMYAKDLETDENSVSRSNSGSRNVTGTGSTTTAGNVTTTGSGTSTNEQDIDNTQSSDTSTREASASVVHAEDQLTAAINYDWSDAADNVHEIRNRAGDSHQHMESTSTSSTSSTSNSTSTTTRNNEATAEENSGTVEETSELTNKQFIQERQWSIQTARDLLPLDWLKAQLKPMFYLLY